MLQQLRLMLLREHFSARRPLSLVLLSPRTHLRRRLCTEHQPRPGGQSPRKLSDGILVVHGQRGRGHAQLALIGD
jgi:hypothetical protein